jgi:hypothetical protein
VKINKKFVLEGRKRSTLDEPFNFQFDADGTYIGYGTVATLGLHAALKTTFGSEHWLSETGDFFRFNSENSLVGLMLCGPKKFVHVSLRRREIFETFELRLVERKDIFAPIMSYAALDINSRIYCCVRDLSDFADENLSAVALRPNFYLLVNQDGELRGYCVSEPLAFLVLNPGGKPDEEQADEVTYEVIFNVMHMLSEDFWDQHDNDGSKIAQLLKQYLADQIVDVKGLVRKACLNEILSRSDDWF